MTPTDDLKRPASADAILDGLPAGVYRTSRDGRVLYANRAMIELLGRTSQSALIGQPVQASYVDPADRAQWQALLERDGVVRGFETRIRTPDGRVVWVRDSARVVRDDDGNARYYEGVLEDITATKEVEVQLRRQQDFLYQSQAVAQIGSWEWDVERDEVIWSDELFRIYGIEPGSRRLRFDTYLERVHPDDRAMARDITQQAFHERKSFAFDHRIIRPDGSVRWLHGRGRVVTDKEGKVVRMLGSSQDITDAKRAGEALRESEERFRTVADALSEAVWDWDVAAGTIWWGEGFGRLFDYSPDEIVPEFSFWQQHIHADDRDRVLATWNAAIEGTATAWSAEYRFRRKDGSYATVLDRGEIFRDASGQAVRAVGAMMDVTDRRLAEQQLAESEAQLRILMENAGDAFYLFDADGRIAEVNQRACDDLGYTRDELLELTIPDVETRARRDQVVGPRLAGLEPGAVMTVESLQRRKDGSTFPVEVRVGPIVVGGRRLYLALARNVQERRHLEEQLRQAQKMEAVGRLAGGIAHDFNNLLTAIIGNADLLLLDMPETSPYRSDIEEIRRAANRAAGLTSQLLAFSRKQMLMPRVLNVNAVVRESRRLLVRLIGEDIHLETRLDEQLGPVKVDPTQMQQVIMNLAVNARDAMPRGGRLTITTQNVELAQSSDGVEPGPYVMLCVSDTGIGMSSETCAHIFEPFFTTKEPGKGTGLGLAMVYGFVKQSGGHVNVDSEPDLGSTFRIYLPRAALDERDEAEGAPEMAEGGTETILLVEDEDSVRGLATRILAARGYMVLTARGGPEARRVFARHRDEIVLIVTDVVMPGESGPQLAEDLCRAKPDLKVLYISGYTGEAMEQHGIVEAETAFLQKPFTPAVLARRVREVLGEPMGG